MLENELASYRGVEKPVTIKDNKLNKRRLTTGNIRKSGAASRKRNIALRQIRELSMKKMVIVIHPLRIQMMKKGVVMVVGGRIIKLQILQKWKK